MAEPVPGISAVPDESNARYFHVVVAGPEGVCLTYILLLLLLTGCFLNVIFLLVTI